MVIVDILLATICFSTPVPDTMECHNALIGGDTPKGTYQLIQRLTPDPLYGGDVLQFRDDPDEIYAIHRVWLGRPWEKREKRIKMADPKQRRVTRGCINVEPAVYQKIVDCCSNDTLIIK